MKIFRLIIVSTILFSSFSILAQTKKTANFYRTEKVPVIDGVLNDDAWSKSTVYSDFQQHDPVWNAPTTQKTEVRLCYSDNGIYIGATMYDSAPDSIRRHLGMRDASLHADNFSIEFDPYNTMQDYYNFQISASGVQSEWKETDGSYNAVWDSKVIINEKGWVAELYIPFSAITFPTKDIQEWRVQFYRYIRRNRELDSWCLEEKTNDNYIQFWSKSENLSNVKPPLRLFLTPYINALTQTNPAENNNNKWSNTINGGLDLKWGVNQSYTMDITLLPDFSQVQSDNQVKNLSAFETVYGDYRPFFYESMSLFQQGDLIYSRRIGKQPSGYYNVESKINTNEKVAFNPQSTQLLNALKFYGRSSNGLAVGVFNAITNRALAYIDDDLGNRRSIETEPLTNYNILVIDKALKGKSNIFLSNANTFRGKNNTNANVSALGGTWYFADGNYKIYFLGGMSRRVIGDNFYSNKAFEGFKYDFTFAKTNGKLKYSAYAWIKDKHYDPNDMGINFVNDEISSSYNISYTEPDPFWKVMSMYNSISADLSTKWSTGMITNMMLYHFFRTNSKNYVTYWSNITVRPISTYDYYEPRQFGRYYKTSELISVNTNFSTDYRNPFALDGTYQITYSSKFNGNNNYFTISPLIRIGNHINMRYISTYSSNSGQRGYAGTDSINQIIFGKRWVQNVENTISAEYVIKNSLSLNLRSRYYWSKGKYSDFYVLNEDGNLSNSINGYNENHDFIYSAFNFDLTFQWDFAPGSSLMLTYKNELIHQLENADKNYMHYLRYSFDAPQANTLALKILYFIDGGTLLKKVKSKKIKNG